MQRLQRNRYRQPEFRLESGARQVANEGQPNRHLEYPWHVEVDVFQFET